MANEQSPIDNLHSDINSGEMNIPPPIFGREQFSMDQINVSGESARADAEQLLSADNRGFFRKMSDGGREIAGRFYETLYKIPVVNRVVGKMEIAYNQFWTDRHQDKAVALKTKMDGIDRDIKINEQAKNRAESSIAEMKERNMPGVESFQKMLQEVERRMARLSNEKDKIQSKFEARDDKIKSYTNERDGIADRLINYYGEKLKPMEVELEQLQTCQDEIGLLIAVEEGKNREQLARIDDSERQAIEMEASMRSEGVSERKIKQNTKLFRKVIAEGRAMLESRKKDLLIRRGTIGKRIMKVNVKANPYRDKQEEFIRVKNNRPIDISVPEREGEKEFTGREEMRAHFRKERSREEEIFLGGREQREGKSPEIKESDERFTVSDYIEHWNEYLKKRHRNSAEFIQEKDFFAVTKLSERGKLEIRDFKNILGWYLRFKKLPMKQFYGNINEFEGKIKSAK